MEIFDNPGNPANLWQSRQFRQIQILPELPKHCRKCQNCRKFSYFGYVWTFSTWFAPDPIDIPLAKITVLTKIWCFTGYYPCDGIEIIKLASLSYFQEDLQWNEPSGHPVKREKSACLHRPSKKELRAIDFGHQKRLESLNFWNFWKWLHMIVL